MDTLNQHDEATQEKLSFDLFRNEVLKDYKTCCISRETSLLGRKEVLTGKAKFGIFGDGKEVAQVAMAKFFRNGDFRSGYYRDQTFMFSSGLATVEQFFAQLIVVLNNTVMYESQTRMSRVRGKMRMCVMRSRCPVRSPACMSNTCKAT